MTLQKVHRYNHRKGGRFYSLISFALDTKLIEDIVYHILSGCDVHDGLRCIDELLDQVLVLLGAVAHQETDLHGMELIPCLDLHRG